MNTIEVAAAASSPAAVFLNSRDPGALILTTLAFFAGLALVSHLSSRVAGADANASAKSVNRLVALLGGLCGWILGMLFTPYSELEAKQFVAVSTVVSVFLSGYVVSKLDRFLERTLFGSDAGKVQESWARAGLFAASLLLACVTLFTARLYAASNLNTAGAIGITPSTSASAPNPVTPGQPASGAKPAASAASK